MSKCFFQMNIIVVLLLLFLIPSSQAVPDVTSYWGSVTFDGISQTNASVTVIDSSGNTVASATSDQWARYSVVVPWADSYTQSESLTFKVNGKTATTTTIGGRGDDINLNLAATSSGGTYPTPTLVDSYLPPGATPEVWKAGVIRAMDDYFAEPSLITKPELLSVMDAYFS